jgi:hypothetical protein
MKYLCLVYCEEEKLHTLPESPKDDECLAYADTLRKSGHLIAGEALESVQTATTVRVCVGKVSVTDGPFAETKEQTSRVLPDRRPGSERGYPGGFEDSTSARG